MRLLLDTHTFLWWTSSSTRLSPRARTLVADPGNTIYVSAATSWEIAIKFDLHRLSLPEAPAKFVPHQLSKHGFTGLAVEHAHALHVSSLPALHTDPFDRLLVAQAQTERLRIVTVDPRIRQYPVATEW